MKKIAYLVITLVCLVAFLMVFSSIRNPSSSDAIGFVEKSVREMMRDPDSATFDNVNFYPDSSEQGKEISGSVCGYVNGKNSFNAYTGRVRFFSRITVTNNGRTANYSPPTIEDKSNPIVVSAMDQVWKESCKPNYM